MGELKRICFTNGIFSGRSFCTAVSDVKLLLFGIQQVSPYSLCWCNSARRGSHCCGRNPRDSHRNAMRRPTLLTSLANCIQPFGSREKQFLWSELDHGRQISITLLNPGKMYPHKSMACGLTFSNQWFQDLDAFLYDCRISRRFPEDFLEDWSGNLTEFGGRGATRFSFAGTCG